MAFGRGRFVLGNPFVGVTPGVVVPSFLASLVLALAGLLLAVFGFVLLVALLAFVREGGGMDVASLGALLPLVVGLAFAEGGRMMAIPMLIQGVATLQLVRRSGLLGIWAAVPAGMGMSALWTGLLGSFLYHPREGEPVLETVVPSLVLQVAVTLFFPLLCGVRLYRKVNGRTFGDFLLGPALLVVVAGAAAFVWYFAGIGSEVAR